MKQLPKYQLLASKINDDIKNGLYREGDRLPSENELTSTFGLSRQTVRQALSLLERDGLISRRQGSGSLVKRVQLSPPPSHNVAVITTYIGEYIFPDILRGIEETLSASNYSPLVFATQNRIDNERKILLDVLSRPLDGMIVEGTKTALPNPNLDLYQKWQDMGRPIVFVHSFYPGLTSPVYVVTDDRKGGYDATQFLINKGHRQIAGIFKSDDIQGHRRCAGYYAALLDNKLSMSDDHILWYTTEEKKELAFLHLSEKLKGCTAVVCYNDEIAVQVLDILRKQNIKVPEEIALISFDNSSYSNFASVKISSCSHHKRQIGKTAAQKLLSLIHGAAQDPLVVPWTIIEKEST